MVARIYYTSKEPDARLGNRLRELATICQFDRAFENGNAQQSKIARSRCNDKKD